MRHVYLLQSETNVDRLYDGLTPDLRKQSPECHAGRSPHGSKYAPLAIGDLTSRSATTKAGNFPCPIRIESS